MTIYNTLAAISAYPIPRSAIENALDEAGLAGADDCTKEVRNSSPYKRAKATLYIFLATAPNISQNGISYSLTDADKDMYRRMANNLLEETGEVATGGVEYGYQGDNF